MGKASRRRRRERISDSRGEPAVRSMSQTAGHRLTMGLAAALGLTALTTYVLTLHPSVAGGDSGELVAVAYTLGTAHPPGYPLYTLLGKLATLLPIGSIAWRVNLLSAVLDASAAVMLLLAVTRWTGNVWAGLAAGGLFAFAPIVWSYAVVAEVFALNNLFVATLLWLGVRFQERRDDRTAGVIALTLGLAASNHHTIVLFGAPFGLWLVLTGSPGLRRARGLLRMAALFAAGLLPYVYLPLASARLPLMTWGDFSSARGFLDHFLRRDYGTFQLGAGDAVGHRAAAALLSYLSDLPAELLVVGILLAAGGLIVRLRREGPLGLASVTAVGVALYLAVFGTLANLDLENALLYGVVARFWQQPLVWMCAWAGLGFAACAAALERSIGARWRVALVTSAAAAFVLLQLGLHYDDQDQHENTVVVDYGRSILESMPSDALLVSLGDLDTNSMRYLQLCEQVRPDVRVIDRAMLHYSWARRIIAANYPDVTLPSGPFSRRDDGDPRTAGLTELIDLNANRPAIFMSRLNADEDRAWQQRYRSWPYGAVEWIVPVGVTLDLERYVTRSNAARRALQSGDRQDWPDTSWEAYVWDRYRDAEFDRGLKLLQHGIATGDDRRPFELARSVFEDLSEVDPAPTPALFKDAGLTYRYLADFDPSYRSGMVRWWTRYLQQAPAADPEVAAIRAMVEEAEAGD